MENTAGTLSWFFTGLVENALFGVIFLLLGQVLLVGRAYLASGTEGFQTYIQNLFSDTDTQQKKPIEFQAFILGRVLLAFLVAQPLAITLAILIQGALATDPYLSHVSQLLGSVNLRPSNLENQAPVEVVPYIIAASGAFYLVFNYALWGIPAALTLIAVSFFSSAFLSRAVSLVFGSISGDSWLIQTACGVGFLAVNTTVVGAAMFFLPKAWLLWIGQFLWTVSDKVERSYAFSELAPLQQPFLQALAYFAAAGVLAIALPPIAIVLAIIGLSYFGYVLYGLLISRAAIAFFALSFVWFPAIALAIVTTPANPVGPIIIFAMSFFTLPLLQVAIKMAAASHKQALTPD